MASDQTHSDQPEPYCPSGQRVSSTPFPRYRHLPGVTSHPRRDPSGHSFGKPEEEAQAFRPANWRNMPNYLYGVDLYNFAYYWEAHEAWEAIWKTTERTDLTGTFLQGLIQNSAALLKREMWRWAGMKGLSEASLEKLRRVHACHPVYCGIDLGDFSARLETIYGAADKTGWPADPRIHLADFQRTSSACSGGSTTT